MWPGVSPARHGTCPAKRATGRFASPSGRAASVGVDDSGGTGTRTETTDRPSTGDRTSTPPPDNPESPGQPSRLESRARAREAPESQAAGVQDSDSGPVSPQAAGGARNPEAPARPENAQAPSRLESRARAQEVQEQRKTENVQDPGDKPTTQESVDRPSADNTGTSSETPRADSLRAAGWKLEGYGEAGTEQRNDRDQEAGEASSAAPIGDRQHGPGDPPGEAELESEKQPETGRAGSETGSSVGGGETGHPSIGAAETAGTGERDQDPRTTDIRQPSPQTHTGIADTYGPRDNGQQSEAPAGRTEPTQDQPLPGLSEAGPADENAAQNGQDKPDLPQQDAQPPQGDDRPTGQAETTVPPLDTAAPPETDEARPVPEALNEPHPTEQTPQPHPGRAGDNTEQRSGPLEDRPESATDDTQTGGRAAEPSGPADHNPQPPAEQSSADGRSPRPESPERPADEQGEPRTTDNAPGPRGTAGDEQEPRGSQGERDADHDKKAENDGSERNQNETNKTNPGGTGPVEQTSPPSRDSVQSSVRETSGTELAPHQENSVETEPGRFGGRVRIAIDSDGRPIPDRRPDAESDTPGRGDSLGEDPAERYEPDPENQSPLDRFLRTGVSRASDFQGITKADGSIVDALLRPPPTGKAEVGTGPYMEPLQTNAATGNAALSLGLATVVAVDLTRRATRGIRSGLEKMKEHRSAGH